MLIVMIEVLPNGRLKGSRTAMGTASDLFARDLGEPSLDLAQPRGRSGCEVHLESWMACKPRLDRGRLVRAVVVHHQMHIQLGRHVGLDSARKPQELSTAMAPMQFTDHFSGSNIERGKQGGRAMAHVVVRAPFGDVRGQLAYFLHEQRIVRELEGLLAMRLQTEGLPNARHRRVRQTQSASHAARAPLRGISRFFFQRLGHYRFDQIVADLPRRARPRLIEHLVQ